MNLNQCIFCEANNELNTQLIITLDDSQKITVKICDKHAEDATVRSAKEAYVKKRAIIQEFLDKAKELGLELNESSTSKLTTVTSKPKPITPTELVMTETIEDVNDPNVVKTDLLDKRQFKSVGGDAGGTQVSSHTSFDVNSLQDKLPDELREGYAQLSVMEGRAGQPITIPHKRVDGTGVTRITIKKSENDDKLQSRFKKMAQDSMSDNIPDFARAGYQNTTRSCPICRGSGNIIQQKTSTLCPKCNGSGMISIY